MSNNPEQYDKKILSYSSDYKLKEASRSSTVIEVMVTHAVSCMSSASFACTGLLTRRHTMSIGDPLFGCLSHVSSHHWLVQLCLPQRFCHIQCISYCYTSAPFPMPLAAFSSIPHHDLVPCPYHHSNRDQVHDILNGKYTFKCMKNDAPLLVSGRFVWV